MARRRTLLELEELGPRTLPSVTALPIPAPLPNALAHLASAAIQNAVGTGHGGYSTSTSNPSAGIVYRFQGAGHLVGMGDVEVNGTLQGVGNVRQGQAHGTLIFFNVWGSVTVEVTGPEQHGSALPTGQFNFRVIRRTGAGDIVPLPDRSLATLILTRPPAGHPHGTFQVSI